MSDGNGQESRGRGAFTEKLDLIRTDPDVMGGVPTFVGTRIPVWNVVKLLASGASQESISASYPAVTLEHVHQAQKYAAENAEPKFRSLGELNPDWVVLSRGVLRPARPEARAKASMDPLLVSSLSRFLEAQAPVYDQVVSELRAGKKQSHWMWFIFPQLAALGRSATAKFYGLQGIADAAAYIAHPVLGSRMTECVDLVLGVEDKTAYDIFGSPDDIKFRSCLTLFEAATQSDADRFAAALSRFYAGERDMQTLSLLR